MTDKEYEKLEKILGKEYLSELEASAPESLKQAVVTASQAMKLVAEELEANKKYVEIKEQKKALEEGKREVNKRQRAIIKYSLQLIQDKGLE